MTAPSSELPSLNKPRESSKAGRLIGGRLSSDKKLNRRLYYGATRHHRRDRYCRAGEALHASMHGLRDCSLVWRHREDDLKKAEDQEIQRRDGARQGERPDFRSSKAD